LGGPFQIWGYVAAQMLCLPVYGLLHWSVSRVIGSPNYKPFLYLLAGTAIPLMMTNQLPPFFSIPSLIVGFSIACLASPELRAVYRELEAVLNQKLKKA
jgi:hypothetical protein